jgi:hypothetical protein
MNRHPLSLRSLLISLPVVAMAAWWAAGRQGPVPNDADDPSPIRAGYAVITPSGGAGLVVFETFGQRRGNETVQAGVLPANLTKRALVFVNTSGRLSRNLGVAVSNPGSAAAHLELTLRDEEGKVVATATSEVAARNQIALFVTELFAAHNLVSRDLTGTLEIVSDVPVAAVALRFRGLNFSALPVTSLSDTFQVPEISTGVGGPGAIILPHFATGGGWATEIVIANPGAAEASGRVDLFARDGSPLTAVLNGRSGSTFDFKIPAGGIFTLAPRNRWGDSDF